MFIFEENVINWYQIYYRTLSLKGVNVYFLFCFSWLGGNKRKTEISILVDWKNDFWIKTVSFSGAGTVCWILRKNKKKTLGLIGVKVDFLFCFSWLGGNKHKTESYSPAIKTRVSETSEELSNKDQRVNSIKFTHT